MVIRIRGDGAGRAVRAVRVVGVILMCVYACVCACVRACVRAHARGRYVVELDRNIGTQKHKLKPENLAPCTGRRGRKKKTTKTKTKTGTT